MTMIFSGPICFGRSATTVGVTKFTMDQTNGFTAGGNVTAYSDERLKTNWRPLSDDFVELLARVKHGIYDRVDTDETQAGVGAQSLQTILLKVVSANADGMLSVAYGNAALVAAIKLAERVVALEARLAALER